MNKRIIILYCAITILNFVYGAFLPLHADEAYYWVWSKNLQLSYFDHPPMVAYLIRICTVISQSEWAIRLVSVLSVSATALIIYDLAKRMFTVKIAELSLILFLFLPITQLGAHIVTPELPLIFFWAATLYLFYIALFEAKQNYLFLAGGTAGLMLLSKYTGILLLPAVLIILLTSRHRTMLLRKPLYLAFSLSLLIISPVLVWNSLHNWISFKFQFTHGIATHKILNWDALGLFLAGQAGIINPIFFLSLLYYSFSRLKTNLHNEKLAFLFWPFIIVFGFFLYASLFKQTEPNWPSTAYITGVILLAYWLNYYKNKWIPVLGITLTIILVILVRFPEAFPFLPDRAILKTHYYGYRELYQAASRYISSDTSLILSDSYQNASLAWYYLANQPEVYILTTSRMSNYDLWQEKLVDKPFTDAIYFGDPSKLPELQALFEKVDQLDVLTFKNRYVTRSLTIYRCKNYLGPQKPRDGIQLPY